MPRSYGWVSHKRWNRTDWYHLYLAAIASGARQGAVVGDAPFRPGYSRFLLGGKSRENTGCSINFLGS